jgi:hypothetical protein
MEPTGHATDPTLIGVSPNGSRGWSRTRPLFTAEGHRQLPRARLRDEYVSLRWTGGAQKPSAVTTSGTTRMAGTSHWQRQDSISGMSGPSPVQATTLLRGSASSGGSTVSKRSQDVQQWNGSTPAVGKSELRLGPAAGHVRSA